MPNYERPDNENLFQIPINNIEPILSDANHILIQDVNSVIEDLFSIELNIILQKSPTNKGCLLNLPNPGIGKIGIFFINLYCIVLFFCKVFSQKYLIHLLQLFFFYYFFLKL